MSQALSKDFSKRKIIYITETLPPLRPKNFLMLLSETPTEIKFPFGHPLPRETYVAHPFISDSYFHVSNYERLLFYDKVMELNYLLQCLGAKSIKIKFLYGEDTDSFYKTEHDIEVAASRIFSGQSTYNKSNEDITKQTKRESIKTTQTFNPKTAPFIPDNLLWYHHERTWQKLAEQRLKSEILTSSVVISSKDLDFVTRKEKTDFDAEFGFILTKLKGEYSGSKLFTEKKEMNTEWEIQVEFVPKDKLVEKSETDKGKIYLSNSNILPDNEKEYIELLEDCLLDGVITEDERRILNRMKNKYSISEERASELEENVKNKMKYKEEENEYMDEVKGCYENNDNLSNTEKRLLDKIRVKLNISEERATELEDIVRKSLNK